MKKLILILLAFISALIITEVIVQFIIRYPKYGVEKSIIGIPYPGKEFVYKPYSKYWNVEGGNNIYSRNNIGLNGIDVNINKDSKNIFVLGNSFVKASEIPPEHIATSVFQKKLNELNKNTNILNLGFYAHDPFQLWYLSQYFRNVYPPQAVILVLERDYEYWMKGYQHPLEFKLPENFGTEETSASFRLISFLRNNSAFINLTASALKLSGGTATEVSNDAEDMLMSGKLDSVPDDLKTVITQFKNTYGDKLIIVSIMPDEVLNGKFAEFCSRADIKCIYDSGIMVPQFRLNKSGHLNEEGNKKLGEKLYEAYEKYVQ
jgi:hypothetical protein